MHARAIRAVGNAGQRTADLVQHVGVAIEIADREFTFTRKLHRIESVGRLLDYDFVTVTERAEKFRTPCFQGISESFQISLAHIPTPCLRPLTFLRIVRII